MDEHIDGADGEFGCAGDAVRVSFRRDVEGERVHVESFVSKAMGLLNEALAGPSDHDDARAIARKCFGKRKAETLTRAGDEEGSLGVFRVHEKSVAPHGRFVDIRDGMSESCQSVAMETLSERLARNIKRLREVRGMTQQSLARLADLPRTTLAELESGHGNPTLAVLDRVATSFQVTIEELVSAPKEIGRKYARSELVARERPSGVRVEKLLPDPIAGMEIDRFLLPPKARMVGVPHTEGTREYLACDRGEVELVASGERFELGPGDLVVFRGDQKHSYANLGDREAVCYSVVVLAR